MPRGLGASKPLRSSEPEASCPLPPSRWLGAIRYFMCKQWRSQGCIFGGVNKRCGQGNEGERVWPEWREPKIIEPGG